ncbi:hypothetical protein [Embleya sp. NBC_00896]|uniref:hypothetical protein n=1 Tax=Embleya sp. NBC_00896 TaxID=2975961 RepID=UPI00386FDF90|nr:hypothetical protein OG928_47350 [Embleya sp. NBC_00896]
MTDSGDVLNGLRGLAIERACGHQVGSDRLIAAGLDALLSGVESPSLPLLAGLGRKEEPDAPDLFAKVLEELDLVPDLPTDRDRALWAMARWWAGLIVDGKLDPVAGADLIWWRVAMELGYPEELQEFVNGAVNGEDWNESWDIPLERIKGEIVEAAHAFMAQGAHDIAHSTPG